MSPEAAPLELAVELDKPPEPVEGWVAEVIGDPELGEAASGPLLVFKVSLANESIEPRRLTFISGSLYAGRDSESGSGRLLYVAPAHLLSSIPGDVRAGSAVDLVMAVPLTADVEAGVERVRRGGDLLLALVLQVVWNSGSALVQAAHAGVPAVRVAKSYWVERILARSKRLRLAVVEVPGLPEDAEFKAAVDALQEAWTLYRLGDYRAALAKAGEALQALWRELEKVDPSLVEARGKGEARRLTPLFTRIAGSEVEALQARRVYRSVSGLLTAAFQRGYNPTRESVELALMAAHALVRFTASKASALKAVKGRSG